MAPDRMVDRIPHAIDVGTSQILLTTLSEQAVREASFLDERALGPSTPARWFPLDAVTAEGRDDAGWIFHIGHCGSTLLSRLLDQVDGALGLREPRSLRDLAQVAALDGAAESPWSPQALEQRLPLVPRLLAQTATPAQRALVKATSHVSEIAPRLVRPGAPVLLLYSRPQNYLETILAGENSRQALGSLSGPRLNRLHGRLSETPWRLWSMGEGERIALGWAAEMTSLCAAAESVGAENVLWVEFDQFLKNPDATFMSVASHFGLALSADRAEAITTSAIMSRYSKAPEHPYDPALRRSLRAEARHEHSAAIHSGLAWLARAAQAYAPIADALRVAEEGRCSS